MTLTAPSAEPRTFPLADILTITTGRLLSRDHMGGVYRILNYLTGDNLMTHQLPRAADACRPPLLRQHPQLAGAEPTKFGPGDIEEWLAEQEHAFGGALTVRPVEGWEHRNPIEELCDMVGPERVIVVVAPEGTAL